MIIKAKPLPSKVIIAAAQIATKLFKRRFNKLVINEAEIKPNHSYILMCNHFSFWDGFFGVYLAFFGVHKKAPLTGFYIMSLKKQMQKNWWLKYIGAFSVSPGSRSVEESLDYAAEVLSKPGNLLLFYPQGNLESSHIRYIEFKDGLPQIIKRINGDCQLIWSSNITEYFESLKPSVYFNMLNCGTNRDFDFEEVKGKVNEFHVKALLSKVRFTDEPGM